MTASSRMTEFKKLVNAEDYFEFFGIPYDQHFVNVNRLHILKQFSLSMEEIDENNPNLSEEETLTKYSEALASAYEVFVKTSPLETKLFKVFNEKPKNVVLIEDIKVE